jgi:hypothetical protein
MRDNNTERHRQQSLYLTEVMELIVARDYMRRYRIVLARHMTWFSALRAIESSSAIATWPVVQAYPMVWGGIIALSQVADALRDVFPFAARHKAANDLTTSLEALLIETLHEAEAVFGGRFSAGEITDCRRKLMRSCHEAGVKRFPNGTLPERADLLSLAQEAADAYYKPIFGSRPSP